jgi:uncharacterized protein (DUF3084 family)
MGQLGAEMDATNAAMCEQQRECNRTSDQMMGLMKERDFLKQQVENLNKCAPTQSLQRYVGQLTGAVNVPEGRLHTAAAIRDCELWGSA